MKKKFLLLYSLSVFTLSAFSQQLVTLQNAVDSALKNSFDIRIAKNNLSASAAGNTLGNAGALPYVNASLSDNYYSTSSEQKLSGESSATKSGPVGENSLNAGLSAGMVLFNGFRVMATRERLNLLQQQSEIE